jgi:hypothetical protein
MPNGDATHWRLTVTDHKRSITDGLATQSENGCHVRCWRRRKSRTLLLALFSVFATFSVVSFSSVIDDRVIVHVPSLFKPTTYEVVPGFFTQSLNSTDDTTFDYVAPHPPTFVPVNNADEIQLWPPRA